MHAKGPLSVQYCRQRGRRDGRVVDGDVTVAQQARLTAASGGAASTSCPNLSTSKSNNLLVQDAGNSLFFTPAHGEAFLKLSGAGTFICRTVFSSKDSCPAPLSSLAFPSRISTMNKPTVRAQRAATPTGSMTRAFKL